MIGISIPQLFQAAMVQLQWLVVAQRHSQGSADTYYDPF